MQILNECICMKTMAIVLMFLAGCGSKPQARHAFSDIVGIDSFALAARYGTPASYQQQDEYLQLNYESAATGCRLIVLIDQDQRVAGWASSGTTCANRAR